LTGVENGLVYDLEVVEAVDDEYSVYGSESFLELFVNEFDLGQVGRQVQVLLVPGQHVQENGVVFDLNVFEVLGLGYLHHVLVHELLQQPEVLNFHLLKLSENSHTVQLSQFIHYYQLEQLLIGNLNLLGSFVQSSLSPHLFQSSHKSHLLKCPVQ
jgi:hypothetical protein